MVSGCTCGGGGWGDILVVVAGGCNMLQFVLNIFFFCRNY